MWTSTTPSWHHSSRSSRSWHAGAAAAKRHWKSLDARAFAYWDPGQPEWPELRDSKRATLPQLRRQERRTEAGWVVEPGLYDVVIANSVADPISSITIELTES
jgi:hypothetical protein